MGSIVWDKNKIMDFDDNDREYLTDYFNSSQIKYIIDGEDFILFPRLSEKIIILESITNNKDERELVEDIKNMLTKEGATVICNEGSVDKSSIEYLGSQISILISFDESKNDITIYMPSDAKKASNLVSKELIKQLIASKRDLTYKISNTWDKLKKVKYWNYLFGNSLVLELSKLDLCETFLKDFKNILVESIIEELGDNISNNKAQGFIYKLKFDKGQLNKETQFQKNYRSTEESINIELEELEKKNEICTRKSKEDTKEIKQNTKESEKIYHDNKEIEAKCNNNISLKIINQGTSNGQPKLLMKYPGEGPSCEFQRPSSNDKNQEILSKSKKKSC